MSVILFFWFVLIARPANKKLWRYHRLWAPSIASLQRRRSLTGSLLESQSGQINHCSHFTGVHKKLYLLFLWESKGHREATKWRLARSSVNHKYCNLMFEGKDDVVRYKVHVTATLVTGFKFKFNLKLNLALQCHRRSLNLPVNLFSELNTFKPLSLSWPPLTDSGTECPIIRRI